MALEHFFENLFKKQQFKTIINSVIHCLLLTEHQENLPKKRNFLHNKLLKDIPRA